MEPTNDCTFCDNAKGYETLTDPTTAVGARVEAATGVSPDGGEVRIDRDVLKDAAIEAFPQLSVEPVVESTTTIAAGGLAVFEKPASDDPREETGLAIPWVALADLAQSLRGLPADLRTALGIDNATTGAEVAAALKGTFPYVPEWLLEGEAPSRLLGESPGLTLPGFDLTDAAPLRPAGFSSIVATSTESDRAAVRGFVRGSWTGLGGHWWGWPFGWQVKMSQPAAGQMSQLLISATGGAKLLALLPSVFASERTGAGTRAVATTAALIMSLWAWGLGANILAVMNNKGVKIQGNWPTIGGPSAFVWATKG